MGGRNGQNFPEIIGWKCLKGQICLFQTVSGRTHIRILKSCVFDRIRIKFSKAYMDFQAGTMFALHMP